MSYPPYKIEGKGDDSYVVDSMGAGVVVSVTIECGYSQTITGAEIMQIICDGLNCKATGKEVR